jgi:hypothetical protein
MAEAVSARLTQGFGERGFEYIAGGLDAQMLTGLAEIVGNVPSGAGGRRWAGDELAALLAGPVLSRLWQMIGPTVPDTRILRVVAFKKDEGANWFVPAHQDRSIPIPSSELPSGFSRPTQKGDGWQAEAPIRILEAMRNVRIFIDPATPEDGPLEVIPGTHRLGRIAQSAIPDLVDEAGWQALTGSVGAVVVLSPLLLHRSRRATQPRGRRVLQIECVPRSIWPGYEVIT